MWMTAMIPGRMGRRIMHRVSHGHISHKVMIQECILRRIRRNDSNILSSSSNSSRDRHTTIHTGNRNNLHGNSRNKVGMEWMAWILQKVGMSLLFQESHLCNLNILNKEDKGHLHSNINNDSRIHTHSKCNRGVK